MLFMTESSSLSKILNKCLFCANFTSPGKIHLHPGSTAGIDPPKCDSWLPSYFNQLRQTDLGLPFRTSDKPGFVLFSQDHSVLAGCIVEEG